MQERLCGRHLRGGELLLEQRRHRHRRLRRRGDQKLVLQCRRRRALLQIARREQHLPECRSRQLRGTLGRQRTQIRYRIERRIPQFQGDEHHHLRHLPFGHHLCSRGRRPDRQHPRGRRALDQYRQRDLPAHRRPLGQRQTAVDEKRDDPERLCRSAAAQTRRRLQLRRPDRRHAAQHLAREHRRPARLPDREHHPQEHHDGLPRRRQ